MKRIKLIALILSVFTAFVVIAGFTTGRATPQAATSASDIQVDHIPSKVTCIAEGHVVGYSTVCREKTGYWCIETFCPDYLDKDKKPILAYCVRYNSILAYANGCRTSIGSVCGVTSCPAGTNAIVTDDEALKSGE